MTVYQVTAENLSKTVEGLATPLCAHRFVVALTGAGISLASGLPLSNDKIQDVPLKLFFQEHFLHSQPQHFYHVYRETLRKWRRAQANGAHQILADRGVWVITQNIDGLHRDVGTEHLLELHGNLRELRCLNCASIFDSKLVLQQKSVPLCPDCGDMLYPGISLEGQEIRHFSLAVDWVGRAEILLIIGTSLEMEPVHLLPEIAKKNQADIFWINSAAEQIVPALFGC